MLTLQIALGVALGILVAFYVIKNRGNFSGIITTVIVYSLLLIVFIANIYYLYFLGEEMKIVKTFSKYLVEENYFAVGFTILFVLGIVLKLGEYFSYIVYGKSKNKTDGNLGFLLALAYGIINLDIMGVIFWIFYKITSTENQALFYLIGIYALATIFRYSKEKNN
jgi:hypothetical protein